MMKGSYLREKAMKTYPVVTVEGVGFSGKATLVEYPYLGGVLVRAIDPFRTSDDSVDIPPESLVHFRHVREIRDGVVYLLPGDHKVISKEPMPEEAAVSF